MLNLHISNQIEIYSFFFFFFFFFVFVFLLLFFRKGVVSYFQYLNGKGN